MKHRKIIVSILLNILFCTVLLWFFSQNAFIRPYLGSPLKECFSGLLLLATLYSNYFIFYPKLCRSHFSLYCSSVVFASFVAGCIELAVGYLFIVKCQTLLINKVGPFHYFSKLLFLVFSRNLAFNFFPYMLRERNELQKSLETETNIVYKYARLLDVCDSKNNCQHISIDDIFYCRKNGNEMDIYTVDGSKFTRYCSLKYLVQHLGNKEFIRIAHAVIVPFRHIASCDGKVVIMKTMSWTDTPITFDLNPKTSDLIADVIVDHLRAAQENADNVPSDSNDKETVKSNPSIPPQDKLDAVFSYIQANPSCRSTEIDSHTSFSLSTIERCLSELKKQNLIEYKGSKKGGGYSVVNVTQESTEKNSLSKKKQLPTKQNPVRSL